jgi:WD40 repeat protein
MDEIEKLKLSISKSLSPSQFDHRLLEYACSVISNTIPEDILSQEYFFYSSYRTIDEIDNLEISILTSNYVIHDLTSSTKDRSIIYWKLNDNTRIHLKTKHDTSSDRFAFGDDVFPYRAELYISDGIKSFVYTAEGERKQVKNLIEFSHQCFHAFHTMQKLKGR